MLDADRPVRHPSALFAIVATAQKLAAHWEGDALRNDTIDAVEAHLKPKMNAVLSAADAAPEILIDALDGLARAYNDARPFLI
jgi:hypothetical protein